jgi:rubrerythrin
MLSRIPFNQDNLNAEEIDREVLRVGIIAELDAINLYEQLASLTSNPKLKEVFLDIAREEKTHVGEFQALLLELDPEQVRELEEGRKEVEEITERKPG